MEKLPQIPSPPGTAFREFRVTVMPFLTFAAVLAATVIVWRQYVGPSTLVGEVQATRSAIVSTIPARVSVLKVRLLEVVKAGQPVAEIAPADPRPIEAQAALTRARLEMVRANIDPQIRKENNLIGYVHLRLDWLNARADLATERAQLVFWENEIDRIRQLAHLTNTAPLVSISGLESAEAQATSFRGRVAEHSTLAREIGAALEQFDPEEKQMDQQFTRSVQAAITVEQRALDAIEAQLNPVVLVSPIDGFVSSIPHNAGESILAGDPIVIVSSAKAERIVAYIRQPLRMEVQPGMTIEIRARSSGRGVGQGKVTGVGAQMEPILPELLPPKNLAGSSGGEYGQPIVISVPPGMRILPGEIVDLHPIVGTP